MSPNPHSISKESSHFLVAGLGALTPALCQLLVVDFRSFQYVALGYVVASAIRPVLSFLIGGMIIHYIYLDERHPGKLFYAGMAAPALIFALANGQKVDLNPSAQQPSATQQKKAGNLRVIYPGAWAMSWAVYAADTAQLKTFGPPQEGFAQQLLRGIVGDVPKNVYFAIAGSYRTLAWAQCWLGDVRVKFPTAEVYGPSGGNNLYSIVIGPQLTIEEAQKEVKDALLFGFADAYVWRLGDPGVPPDPKFIGDQLGYRKDLNIRNAMHTKLLLRRDCLNLIQDILKDPSSNSVRDRDLLLDQLVGVSSDLEQRGIKIPSDVYLQFADVYYRRGKCDVAMVFYAKVDVDAMSSDPEQFCQRGRCTFYAGQFSNANDDLGRCVSLKQKATALDHRMYGRTLVELGRQAENRGRKEEAVKNYKDGLDEINLARNMGDDKGRTQGDFTTASGGLQRLVH
jgi:hypothetical protein